MKFYRIIPILIFLHLTALPAELNGWNDKGDKIHAADSMNNTREFSSPQDTSGTNRINSTQGQVATLLSLSKYYLTEENYIKTLECYFKIIDIYDDVHDIKNLVIEYSRIAQFFLLIKDYDLAEKYLGLMSGIAQKSSDQSTRGQVFLAWAKYYLAKDETDKAIRYLYLTIPCFQSAGTPDMEGWLYKFLGDAFIQKKMYHQSEYYYRTAISVISPTNNPIEIAVLYTRIAHIHQLLDNNKLNLKYNLAALRIREHNGSSVLLSSSLLNVGEAYWLLGRKDSARLYFQKSLRLAEKINNSVQLETVYNQLYLFAKSENHYADALNYYIASADYRAKMNQERSQSEILILEANRTVRASQMQNDLLNQEMLIQGLQIRNRRVQIFLFEVAFVIMLSLILFVHAISHKNRKRKDELTELNTRLRKEISIRIEAEGRLKRSEELHRFLAENTSDVISLMDAGMQRIYISPSCEKLYGYTAAEILRMRSPLDLVTPSFHVLVNQYLLEMFRSKKSVRYIYKILRKDGVAVWAEANINPILDPATREVRNLITVVRDVSERMQHEEELSENSRQKEYLLSEIHNRVKNNFAILISLMNMQRNQSADSELSRSLTDLQLRVRTMSLVHEQLYQTKEISIIPFDNYLHHLALIISSSFNNNRIDLKTEIRPCKVAIEMALPLGLIINELITNAYKYAFPGDRTGSIWIRLLPEHDNKFCISICDNGIGLPADFSMENTQSMGSQIVGILIEQIEATLEVTSEGGACFRILFSTAQEK